MVKIISIINIILSILVMTWALVQAQTIITEEELKQQASNAMFLELIRSAEVFEKNDFNYEENSFQLIRCHYVKLGKDEPKIGYHCEAQTNHATWRNQMVTGTFPIDLRGPKGTPEQFRKLGEASFGLMIIQSKDGEQIYEFRLPRYGIVE